MDFKNNHKIDVMISKMLRGKAPKDFNWSQFHRSFRRYTLSPYQLAGAIWQGYSFTPVFDGSRKEKNFVESWHIAFDFDKGGAAIDHVMKDGHIADLFSSFVYETPSSTAQSPRSRAVFIFDYPLKSSQRMRDLYQAIAWKFRSYGAMCDEQCKDPLRLFYGSPGAKMQGNWSVLGTQSMWDDQPSCIDTIIAEFRNANPIKTIPIENKQPLSKDQAAIVVDRLADNIRYAPDGDKHNQRNKTAYTVGGIVAAGQISQNDAMQILEDAALSNTNNAELAKKEVQQALNEGMQKPLALDLPEATNYTELLF